MRRIIPLLLALILLAGCGSVNMKSLYDTNSLEDVLKKHSSFTLTTTLSDGKVSHRYYEPNMACFYDDEKYTVYLSSGCYSHSEGKYYTEIFLREDYSYHMLKERFTAPLIAQNAKVSRVLDQENNEYLEVRTKPSDAYTALLYEEYGVESGAFEIVYLLNELNEFMGEKIYLDGELFASIAIEYGTNRPEMANDLYTRLTTPANECRTVKVTLDPEASGRRTVIARTVKGDSFKLDVPDGYKSAFANAKCTIPYSSKGADKDAEIYLVYGK